MDVRSEVMNDFNSNLEKIDFSSYNPLSNDFISTLYIGLMSFLLNNKNEDRTERDDIEEEIYGAKKYLQKYIDTSDEAYKLMAEDELKHAGILIKKASSVTLDSNERNKLRLYENRVDDIKKQLI